MTKRLSKADRSRPTRWVGRLLTLGPGGLYLTLFLAVPLAVIVTYSFMRRGTFGGVVYQPTLENYRRAVDPLFLRILWDSVRIGGLTTLLALLIGYPAAFAITKLPTRWRLPALVAIVLPFWSNFLIRTYAWIVLLNREGILSKALRAVGLTDEPVGFLYNRGSVVVGLLYAYLPLMILPLYAALDRIDPALDEASADLGAKPWRTFIRVTVPLSLPGMTAGSIFVFVPSIGNFVVPELLGGGQAVMVGNLIRDQFLRARDWPFGAVLSLSIVGLMMILLVVQAVQLKRTRAHA
ncbi:MAG: spermidine/putrescine ABC transporter permease [Acidimicrobiia bacterium]|nr:MAG: spermidine/putrescine ABC transporter permease [Acidimicrobiia bacterium]